MRDKVIIYTDIESIMDLRQGFLASKGVDNEELIKYIASEDYNLRNNDNLMGFTYKEYREAIASGDKEILKNSILAFNFSTLVTRVLNVSVKSSIEGVKYIPNVWVNIHPFTLSDKEKDLIKDAIFSHLNCDCFIDIISNPHEDISPAFIDEMDIDCCFIYDFSKWLDLHGDKLPKKPLMKTDLYFPPIYAEPPNEEQLKKLKELGYSDGFEYIEFSTSPYSKISFLPITYYSNSIIANDYITAFNNRYKAESEEKGKEYKTEVEEYLNEHLSRWS